MKILVITYKDNIVISHRVTSSMVLVGRSPLCDVVLRTPGVNSVQFIMEWIGVGDFDSDNCAEDEWVITEITRPEGSAEKKLNKTATGEGCLFHKNPIQMGKYGFYWKEDRLGVADLSNKMISQQLSDYKESSVKAPLKQSNTAMLEMICLDRDIDAVSEIFHYKIDSNHLATNKELLPFQIQIEGKVPNRSISLKLPVDSSYSLHRPGNTVDQAFVATQNSVAQTALASQAKQDSVSRVSIQMHDLLHIEAADEAYYFRIVPRVAAPKARRSIFSDPFYVITTLCLLVGAIGFFFIFKNTKNTKKALLAPPRIAVVEVMEVVHAQPKEEEKKPESEKLKLEEPPEPPPPKPVPPQNVNKQETAEPNKLRIVPNQMPAPRQVDNSKKAPLTEKNKGGLANDAEISKNNVVGFLSGIKKPKTLGLVKADQILAKGVVSETMSGKNAEVFLDQSAQGMVNKDTRLSGENLAAATTKLNLKDQVGMNSLTGTEAEALKHGLNISYGDNVATGNSSNDQDLASETAVEGGLDRVSVKAAIKGYSSEIRTCYERALRVKSSVNGRIVYKFQIAAAGNLQWVQILKSNIDSPTLANCVQDVLKTIKFPVAKNGQNTIVIYPFQFNKKGN